MKAGFDSLASQPKGPSKPKRGSVRTVTAAPRDKAAKQDTISGSEVGFSLLPSLSVSVDSSEEISDCDSQEHGSDEDSDILDEVVQDNEGDMQHADDEKMVEKKKKKPRKAQNKKQEELLPPAGRWTLCRKPRPSKCYGCGQSCPAWVMKLLYEPRVAGIEDLRNWNASVFYRFLHITCTCWSSKRLPFPVLETLVLDVPDKSSSSRDRVVETAEAKQAEIDGALNRLREELDKL